MATKPNEHRGRVAYDRRTRERQHRFLKSYAELGNDTAACKASKVNIDTVRRWYLADTLGFNASRAEAEVGYADFLADLAHKRLVNPEKGVGSDILLIAGLGAHGRPEWRQQTVILNDDTPIKVLQMLKEMAGNSPRVVQGRSKPALPEGQDQVEE